MKKTIVHLLVIAFVLSACATTPSQSPSVGDEALYNKGTTEMARKFYTEAIEHFETLREKFPLSKYAVLALLRQGECQFFQKNYIEAQYSFDTFRRMHPSHEQVDYSMYMSGLCQFKQILEFDRDQTFARAAVVQFGMLVEAFPNSPYSAMALCKIVEAKQHIAEYEFFVGSFYLRF